eukprot:Skav233883  [mRNA]  locus=scaffold435:73301:74856:+ [translate_table: standard]
MARDFGTLAWLLPHDPCKTGRAEISGIQAEELPEERPQKPREDDSVGIPLGPAQGGDVRDGANYCYLILFNLNKKNNLGAILRSCAAFGVRLVMLVGRQGFKAPDMHWILWFQRALIWSNEVYFDYATIG